MPSLEKTVKAGRCLRNSSKKLHPALLIADAIPAGQDCPVPPPPSQFPFQHLAPAIKTHFQLFNNSSMAICLVNGRKVFYPTGKPGQEGRSLPTCETLTPSNWSHAYQMQKLQDANFLS